MRIQTRRVISVRVIQRLAVIAYEDPIGWALSLKTVEVLRLRFEPEPLIGAKPYKRPKRK
jgi:hypothetical protein